MSGGATIAGWSNDKIMHEVSDIASDPSLKWVQQGGRAGAELYRSGAPLRYAVEGVRDGVKMRAEWANDSWPSKPSAHRSTSARSRSTRTSFNSS